MNSTIDNLVIIGNGFDLHHKIRCNYSNYRYWLIKNNRELYNRLKRMYCPIDPKSWWSTFEASLGQLNLKKYPHQQSQKNYWKVREDLVTQYSDAEDFLDNYELSHSIEDWTFFIESVTRYEMEKIIEDLNESFHDWVCNLNKPKMKYKVKNIEDSLDTIFLNFNYTKTLEDYYDIDEDSVTHIHSSIDSPKLYFGHNRTTDELLKEYVDLKAYSNDPDKDDNGESNCVHSMINSVELIKKPTDEIILENSSFFNSLSNIQKITTYGFSFSDIDLPYIDEILSYTGKKVFVEYSYHSNKEKEYIRQVLSNKGIKQMKPFFF